jgi:hypothetical protein
MIAIQVEEGTINDVVDNIELIRNVIPAKADLSEEEIRNRMESKRHGVLLAKKREQSRWGLRLV